MEDISQDPVQYLRKVLLLVADGKFETMANLFLDNAVKGSDSSSLGSQERFRIFLLLEAALLQIKIEHVIFWIEYQYKNSKTAPVSFDDLESIFLSYEKFRDDYFSRYPTFTQYLEDPFMKVQESRLFKQLTSIVQPDVPEMVDLMDVFSSRSNTKGERRG